MTGTLAKRDKRSDPREAAFLAAYFQDGPTQGEAKKSALAAGYAEDKAEAVSRRILKRFDKLPFMESAVAAGITKPKLALMLKNLLYSAHEREVLTAIKMLLGIMGEEIGDSKSATVNVSGQGAQILVVAGTTPDRMKRLKSGTSSTGENTFVQ